ncbi:hypothetical protein C1N64_22005 (plasmid) [Pantoea sp. SGAir0215]
MQVWHSAAAYVSKNSELSRIFMQQEINHYSLSKNCRSGVKFFAGRVRMLLSDYHLPPRL